MTAQRQGRIKVKNFRYRLASLTLRYRGWSALILTALTVFFALGLPRVELRTIFTDLFPKNHPFVETFKDHPNFGNPLTVVIMVKRKHGDLYDTATLAKVWRMTREIDLAPAVDHDQILSITTEKARYAEATPEGIDTKPLIDDHAPQTAAEVGEFKHRVEMAPNVRTFLISRDETATLITATFIEQQLDYGKTFRYVQQLVERERDADHEVYAAGQPMLTGWVYTYEKQILAIFGVTLLALIVALISYMRNVPGVLTPIVVSAVGAIWGFGFVGWLRQPIEPLIMVVPLLLVARSFSHCVQMTERYYEIYYHLRDRRKSAELALSVMMAPGVLGIYCDAAGLLLIALAPIPMMQRFALFCGFWAAMLVPTNQFLTPLLLSWLPAPKNVATLIGRDNKPSAHARVIGWLRQIGTLSHGPKARYTTMVVGALIIVSLGLLTQLKIGNPVEGSNLLWDNSEFNTAVRQINANFPGLMTLEVVFEGKGETHVVKDALAIRTMVRFQRALESGADRPEATLSFADYLPEANRLFSGGNPKWSPVDNSDQAVTAATSALLLGTSTKAYGHVADFTLQNGTVSLWYKNNKQETVDKALAHVRDALAIVGIDHATFRIRLGTGAIALQQSINDTVDHFQWWILGVLNLVILIGCSYAYRSVVAAALLLVPVNLANLLLTAGMVVMGLGLDVNSLPITAIGIGVGIDYGIYLLSRICEEYRDTRHIGNAIQAAVATTGKAIFFTASIMLVGIMPWYFLSGLRFMADMGLLLCMIMMINMLCALVVLPLLVSLFKPKFLEHEHLVVAKSIDLEKLGLESGAEGGSMNVVGKRGALPTGALLLALAAVGTLAALTAVAGALPQPKTPASYLPVRSATAHDALYDLTFDGERGIAVGDHGVILASADGGRTWSGTGAAPTELALLGIAIADGHAIIVGQAGTVLTSADLTSWKPAVSGTDARLFRVELARDGFAVAVGAFGTVLTSANYGRTWSKVPVDWTKFNDNGYEPHLYDVRFARDGSLLVAGEFATVLRSTDRGATWAAVHHGEASIFALTVLPDGHGYAVGQSGLVLKTTDDGASWTTVAVPSQANLLGVWADEGGRVVAVGMHALLESTDGGARWLDRTGRDVAGTWYVAVACAGTGAARAVYAAGNIGTIARVN
jgi:predicted RND superfamily exporter protein/photosystem II stability/assembly factor-like uncharacterized protein